MRTCTEARRVRRSVYCTASFLICSQRRTKLLIFYPDFRLDYKLATLSEMVAMRYKIPVRSITLFLFGSVAQNGAEPPSAIAEFLIATAGR